MPKCSRQQNLAIPTALSFAVKGQAWAVYKTGAQGEKGCCLFERSEFTIPARSVGFIALACEVFGTFCRPKKYKNKPPLGHETEG